MVKSQPLPTLPVDPNAPDDAPTIIGLKELAEDDLTIAGMYRDLARRHDELVESVETWLHKQAK